MGLGALGFLTILAVGLLTARRAVVERSIRWQLYALRDQLRERAYHNRSLLSSPAFRRLDQNISAQCAVLPDVSIWSLLPVMALDHEGRQAVEQRQQMLAEELKRPENAEVSELFDKSVGLMMRHLLWRHMFFTAVTGATLIGLFAVYFGARWASERIISGALKPILPSGPGVAHAA